MDAYSVIIPVYNNRTSVHLILKEWEHLFVNQGWEYEFVIVYDGGTKMDAIMAGELVQNHKNVRIVNLNNHYGQLAATVCGIENAKGKYIITINDDLQYRADELLAFIHFFKQNRFWLLFGVPAAKPKRLKQRMKIGIANLIVRQVLMRSHRKANFFTTFRIFNRNLFLNEQGKFIQRYNLLHLWDFPGGKIGHFPFYDIKKIEAKSGYNLPQYLNYYKSPLLYLFARSWMIIAGILLTIFTFKFIGGGTLSDSAPFHPFKIEKNALFCLILAIILIVAYCLTIKYLSSNKRVKYQVDKKEA